MNPSAELGSDTFFARNLPVKRTLTPFFFKALRLSVRFKLKKVGSTCPTSPNSPVPSSQRRTQGKPAPSESRPELPLPRISVRGTERPQISRRRSRLGASTRGRRPRVNEQQSPKPCQLRKASKRKCRMIPNFRGLTRVTPRRIRQLQNSVELALISELERVDHLVAEVAQSRDQCIVLESTTRLRESQRTGQIDSEHPASSPCRHENW